VISHAFNLSQHGIKTVQRPTDVEEFESDLEIMSLADRGPAKNPAILVENWRTSGRFRAHAVLDRALVRLPRGVFQNHVS